jgi:hypothetical protein
MSMISEAEIISDFKQRMKNSTYSKRREERSGSEQKSRNMKLH